MSKVPSPPTYNAVVQDDGIATNPWILFFNAIYTGDTGTSWNPTFTNLTTVGIPTITGRYYKISQSLVLFKIKIIAGTNTSATSASTYCDNFPLTFRGDGICFAVTAGGGSTSGHVDSSNNRIYVPAWTTIATPLTIIGIAEAQ